MSTGHRWQRGRGDTNFADWASERFAGVVGGETVSVQSEVAGGGMVKTVLKLTNTPVTVTSVTTGNGVGGTTIYTLPEGLIRSLGGTADLAISIATADQADFTDATPEGDLGIGTLAPANADALGTDATDDNICTAAAFTMASYADSDVKLTNDVSSVLALDGTGGSPVNIVLTALVDAADIDDGTTSTVYVSGTVTLLWANTGDDD